MNDVWREGAWVACGAIADGNAVCAVRPKPCSAGAAAGRSVPALGRRTVLASAAIAALQERAALRAPGHQLVRWPPLRSKNMRRVLAVSVL